MMRTMRKGLIACLACLCLAMLLAGLLGGGTWLMHASAAEGDVPSATTVPEEKLEQLSMDNGTLLYAMGTGTKTVQFKPTAESGGDYSLANATDLAIRFKVVNRQANRPNVSSGLCYVRIKFAGNDTVWGVTKEDMRFTFVNAATNEIESVRVSNGVPEDGSDAIGGQLNVPVRTDGTVYFPLTQIRDGVQQDALGNRLTDTADYQNLTVEYIEFTYSAHRWNWAIGDIALVRQAENTVTTDVLDLTPEAVSAAQTLYSAWYDNVKLVVNGTDATVTADGAYEVDLGAPGKVRIPSDKVFAYDPVVVTSELAEGYGITQVVTSAEGKEIPQRGEEADNLTASGYNKDRSALSTGYTYEGEYFLRRGNHGLHPGGVDDTATLGTEPLDATIEVTVSPLVALEVTGETTGVNIYYFRLGTMDKFACVYAQDDWTDMPDDGSDGKIWLKPDEEATLLVVPETGYVFTGLKLNEQDVTTEDTNISRNEETGQIIAALYKISIGEESTLEVLGMGEETPITFDIAEEGGSVTVDGAPLTEETLTSNVFKTHIIDAIPEKGYAAHVSVIYPAEEEGGEAQIVELEASSDGKYYYQVDKAFTLKITFDVVTYKITYRLNNGEYAAGESNPETITYFETATLKNLTRDGYDFKGWRIEGETDFVTELKEVESDLTLIAVFELADTPAPGPGDDPDPGDDPGPGDDPNPGTEEPSGGLPTGAIVGICVGAVVLVAAVVVAVVLIRKKIRNRNK